MIRQRSEDHKKKIKEWKEKNVDIVKEYSKKFYESKKEFILKYNSIYQKRKNILKRIGSLEEEEKKLDILKKNVI